jgi:TPP-dependent 2-oxoacid decarboxylase
MRKRRRPRPQPDRALNSVPVTLDCPECRHRTKARDGAFQVTGQELSTIIRNRLKPVIFLLNNDGYTIERVICDRPYNDIQPWKYHRLLDVFGTGMAFDARTEGELEEALRRAASADTVVFIEVHTDRLDCFESLQRAGATMARANQLDEGA